MPRLSTEQDPLDVVLFALAHRTRRDLLAHLRKGEAKMIDLAAQFDHTLPAVSKHVQALERAGLVRRRVSGREHWISAEPGGLRPAANWIAQQEKFWNDRLDALVKVIAEDKAAEKAKAAVKPPKKRKET